MANFNIVIDTSNFKPFDLSPALKVLGDYRDAYYRYEDALNKISEENGMFDLPDPGDDPRARRIFNAYLKYNRDFQDVSDDFSTGMNIFNQRLVNDIWRRYGREVKPVKQAVEDLNTWKDNLNKLYQSDDSAIVGNGNLSVYDFYGGNRPVLQYKSGRKIEEDFMNYMKGINNSIVKDPKFKHLLEGYVEVVNNNGLKPTDAVKAALTEYDKRTSGQHGEAIENILNHMNKFFDNLGVDNYDENAKREIWGRMSNGLIRSIPEPKNEYRADQHWAIESAKASINQINHNIRVSNMELPYRLRGLQLDNEGKELLNNLTRRYGHLAYTNRGYSSNTGLSDKDTQWLTANLNNLNDPDWIQAHSSSIPTSIKKLLYDVAANNGGYKIGNTVWRMLNNDLFINSAGEMRSKRELGLKTKLMFAYGIPLTGGDRTHAPRTPYYFTQELISKWMKGIGLSSNKVLGYINLLPGLAPRGIATLPSNYDIIPSQVPLLKPAATNNNANASQSLVGDFFNIDGTPVPTPGVIRQKKP